MRFLIAGSLPFLGAALGDALLSRGHSVLVVDGKGGRAHAPARAWLHSRHRGEIVVMEEGVPSLAAMESMLNGVDALVRIGDPRDVATDLELSLAWADACARGGRSIPMLRILALGADDGLDGEFVVLRNGRATSRDLPLGIPEERTLAALGETDLALRLLAISLDRKIVLLRLAEPLMQGRFEFDARDIMSHCILQFVHGVPEAGAPLHHPHSVAGVVDGPTVAIALEQAALRAGSLAGAVLHVGGGPQSVIRVDAVVDLLQTVRAGDVRPAAAPWDEASPLSAQVLDDAMSRREMRGFVNTSAGHAVLRFYQFAQRHRPAGIRPPAVAFS